MQEDNFLATYVAECAEHLETVENDLLEMERLGAGSPPELVNRVFRAAHSIKGGAGFFELGSVKELAHKLENVLEMVRSEGLVPNPEVVNQLLQGFDKMKLLFADIESAGDADVGDEILALTGLASSYLPPEKKEQAVVMSRYQVPGSRLELRAGELLVDSYRSAGNGIALLLFDLIHDVQRLGKLPRDLLAQIEEQGVLLDSGIDIFGVGSLDDDTVADRVPFYVLLSTPRPVKVLAEALDIAPENVQFVELPSFEAPAPKVKPAPVHKPVAETVPPSRPASEVPAADEGEGSIRIAVGVLDQLMNHASELVLARNELLESLRRGGQVPQAARRIDVVTREMQEAVMLTRMQPIGSLFARFPRVVRDLARDTGKLIDLSVSGREVEVDKTILERLSDPLTHLVRNACDHGVEPPQERKAAGKPETGRLSLSARHEAGKIVVEITDDGNGIDTDAVAAKALSLGLISEERVKRLSDKEKAALILLPGLSTARAVTDLSGRGVGMDVVKTNIDQLGGQLDIVTRRGEGTTFVILLPLTLAIIPSLLVSVGGESFAIPEANVAELLRIRPGEVKNRIERLGDRTILNLRGSLIPVVRLAEALGVLVLDRRRRLDDRRLPEEAEPEEGADERSGGDRRYHAESDVRVAVVRSAGLTYALVVDEFHDTMEIVVRPLGSHFTRLREYSGATVLGDGTTALILDTTGLAARAGLVSVGEEVEAEVEADVADVGFLLFGNGPQRCALDLDEVDRVVPLDRSSISTVGKVRVFRHENAAVPLIALSDALDLHAVLDEPGDLLAVLVRHENRVCALAATGPIDSLFESAAIDTSTFRGRGLSGNVLIGGTLTLVVDWPALLHTLNPPWLRGPFEPAAAAGPAPAVSEVPAGQRLLVVDDSDFFRSKIAALLRQAGFAVVTASNGGEALQTYQADRDFAGVITDIEMPGMNGFELARRLRSLPSAVPIAALTALASDEDHDKAVAAGVDAFLVKLDEEELLKIANAWVQGDKT